MLTITFFFSSPFFLFVDDLLHCKQSAKKHELRCSQIFSRNRSSRALNLLVLKCYFIIFFNMQIPISRKALVGEGLSSFRRTFLEHLLRNRKSSLMLKEKKSERPAGPHDRAPRVVDVRDHELAPVLLCDDSQGLRTDTVAQRESTVVRAEL